MFWSYYINSHVRAEQQNKGNRLLTGRKNPRLGEGLTEIVLKQAYTPGKRSWDHGMAQ